MKNFLLIICAVGLLMTGCVGAENSPPPPAEVQETAPVAEKIVNIEVNGKIFEATLGDKRSVRAFEENLPLEIEMTELNGNEKYFYLENDLPTDSVRVLQIHAGDLMLYESNCIVLFYKDFKTDISYTYLGKIKNPEGLAEALGEGNVHVKFKKE